MQFDEDSVVGHFLAKEIVPYDSMRLVLVRFDELIHLDVKVKFVQIKSNKNLPIKDEYTLNNCC